MDERGTDPRARARDTSTLYQPLLLRPSVPAEAAELDALLADGRALFVHDTLQEQLEELVETRAPDRAIPKCELSLLARSHAGDDLARYGTWVYYPWSARLVHVLPEAEYEELRTSRNRNKITRAEQTRLGQLRVGIVGLSVGQSSAVTLALEGIGGLYRLADFDTLSLSNMNRLRAGVHDVGVNKAVLVAREIYEINPYAKIELFTRGLRDDTLPAFFSDREPLDLLLEECDDLKMKFRLREEARRRGIPVLMETSDRGLIDIERFDREPQRPLFHGLVEEVDPERLAGMTTYEKLPLVLAILGAETMSRRMAASLVDIDATLKTWPQLASAVALGGAINADVARRIALDKLTTSGRFFVDFESLIPDRGAIPDARPAAAPAPTPPAHAAPSSPAPRAPLELGPSDPITTAQLERLLTFATMAPSGGNIQPWTFTYRDGILRCYLDRTRAGSFLDFELRGTQMVFGTVAETLRLAAGRLGIGIQVEQVVDPARPTLMCEARLGGAPTALDAEDVRLATQIEHRVTNRRLGARVPLAPATAAALEATAQRSGATLRLVSDAEGLAQLGDLLGESDRFRMLSRVLHHDSMSELRWTREEALATRDGIELDTLELTPSDRAAMRLMGDWTVMSALREVEGGQGLKKSARKSIAASSAVGLLTIAGPMHDAAARARTYFRGGVALQRVWLRATELGLAFQPMTVIVYLFARLLAGGEGFSADEARTLRELRARYESAFRLREPAAEIMLFRIAEAGPPSARALRRPVRDLLSREPD